MSLEEREAAQVGNRRLPSGLVRAIIPPPVEPTAAASRARVHAMAGFLVALEWKTKKKKKRNRIKKDWSETLGNNGTTGLGEFPATFTTTAGSTSCTDFAVFNTGLAGTSSQANIIAYNNLYASCNGGTPTVYWAYNTGTLGGVSAAISNSVVLSLDGTQVAFVQFVPYAVAAFGTETANTGVVPTAGTTIRVGATTYTWETTTNITTVNQMSTSGITLETEIAQTLYAALTGSRANCPTSNTTCIAPTQTANSSVTATVSGETVTVTASCGVGTCGNTVVFTQTGRNRNDHIADHRRSERWERNRRGWRRPIGCAEMGSGRDAHQPHNPDLQLLVSELYGALHDQCALQRNPDRYVLLAVRRLRAPATHMSAMMLVDSTNSRTSSRQPLQQRQGAPGR